MPELKPEPCVSHTPVSESTNTELEGSDSISQATEDQPSTLENNSQETECAGKPEIVEVNRNGDKADGGTQTMMEAMDTSESAETDENVEEASQEMKETETTEETAMSKSAIYQALQNVRVSTRILELPLTLYHTKKTFNDPDEKVLGNWHFLLFPQCFLSFQ